MHGANPFIRSCLSIIECLTKYTSGVQPLQWPARCSASSSLHDGTESRIGLFGGIDTSASSDAGSLLSSQGEKNILADIYFTLGGFVSAVASVQAGALWSQSNVCKMLSIKKAEAVYKIDLHNFAGCL